MAVREPNVKKTSKIQNSKLDRNLLGIIAVCCPAALGKAAVPAAAAAALAAALLVLFLPFLLASPLADQLVGGEVGEEYILQEAGVSLVAPLSQEVCPRKPKPSHCCAGSSGATTNGDRPDESVCTCISRDPEL